MYESFYQVAATYLQEHLSFHVSKLSHCHYLQLWKCNIPGGLSSMPNLALKTDKVLGDKVPFVFKVNTELSSNNVFDIISCYFRNYQCETIMYIGVSPRPPPFRNTPPPLSCQAPPLDLKTVKDLPFRQSPLCIGLSWTPPILGVRFFSEPPKYQSFSSLTPSYFLKVT